MDRPFWFYGPVLRDTDLLNASRFPMVGLAKLSEAVLGTGIAVQGFSVTPTVPASMSVNVGPGQVYQLANLEATQWAAFGPDTHSIVKQGVSLDAQPQTLVAPTGTGFAQNFLVQVAYADQDQGSTVLPYYNAANPSQPYNGPGNSGTAQNTVRAGVANVTLKAGIAATSGSQNTPAPDAGYAGLYVITVAAGQTTITAGNITAYSNAPFIPVTLPGVPLGVQAGKWRSGVDTGAASNLSIALSPQPASLTPLMEIVVAAAAAPTGATVANVAGFGNLPVVRRGGAAVASGDWNAGDVLALRLNAAGSAWMIAGLVPSDVATAVTYYGTDQGSVNALVVNTAAYGGTLQAGRPVLVVVANTTTGPATLNVNGLGAKTIKRPSGFGLADVRANDLRSGQLVQFTYDGASWQVQSPIPGKQYSYFNQKYASSGGIMTAADLGSLVQLGVSSGAFTLTLPVCATCGNGEVISLFHNGNNTDVLQCQGSDKIVFPDGTSVSSITMQAGDTLDLLATATTGFFLVVGGSFFTRYSSDFAHSFGTSGYQKLPGGLIEQWLTVTTTSTSTGTTVNLPTSFANQAFGSVASDTGAADYTWSVALNGTGSVIVYAKNPAGNLVSGATGFVRVNGR